MTVSPRRKYDLMLLRNLVMNRYARSSHEPKMDYAREGSWRRIMEKLVRIKSRQILYQENYARIRARLIGFDVNAGIFRYTGN